MLFSIQACSLFSGNQESGQGESDKFFRSIIDHLPVAVFSKDIRSDFRFNVFNKEAERLLGLKAAEVLNRTDYDLFPELQADFFRAKDNQALSRPGYVHIDAEPITTPKGSEHWLRTTKNSVADANGKPHYLIGTFTDITAERDMLQKLKESEELYRCVVQATNEGIWDWDLNTQVIDYSDRWKAILGYEPDELANNLQTWWDLIHPEDIPQAQQVLEAHLERQEPFAHTSRFRHKDGRWLWILCRGQALRDPEGKPYRMIGSHSDLSEIYAFRTVLEEQRNRLESITSSIPLYIIELDQEGAISWMNATAKRDLMRWLEGASPSFESLFSPAHASDLKLLLEDKQGTIWRDIALGKESESIDSSWCCLLQTNGHRILIGQDISERKANQVKLMESSKMATLGEMAGGVAHEINNPLAIIHLCADQLLRLQGRQQIDPDRIHLTAQRIKDTAGRIAKIVRGLRAFARDAGQDPFEETSIRTLIFDVLDMCEAKLKHQEIDIQVNISGHDFPVFCRPGQIMQVILNLISNAADALSDVASKQIIILAENLGDKIILAIEDSGPGVEESLRDKIMQPFFTTKEVGKGTGLGLSISRGIAESHHGRLYLDRKSVRTRFALELPNVTQPKPLKAQQG